MQWWAWIAVGAILLGAELTFVNAQMYLVFVGAAALLVGCLHLAGLELAAGWQWLIFAVLSVALMMGFRRRIYERMRGRLPALGTGPAGESVTLEVELPPGDSCRLEYRGSSWSAVNRGHTVIAAGARAHIDRVEGLTLVLRGETSAKGG